MNSVETKRVTESLRAHFIHKTLRLKLHEAAHSHVFVKTVPQLKPLTPNQLDALMHRRLDAEANRRALAQTVFGKKKKLPLPVFSCENGVPDCGEAGHSEGRCGNAACMQHRPRVLGGAS